ncbi:MAG: hypothetical protein JJU31_09935 [Wenzhouxiangella sp.]|nr:hypothetical protein [Wenzhouxiangella sp.]MCH8478353.1 hypothetical protein [Wenzhouxiangella sp.]
MNKDDTLDQLAMNPDQLYREEVFTDQETGSIRRLTPVTRDGNSDPGRAVLYIGQTQVMTPAGPLPLSFELEGNNLGEVAGQFAEAAARAIQEAVEEIKRLQREQQSSIMIPGQGGSGGTPGGGLPGGGFPR